MNVPKTGHARKQFLKTWEPAPQTPQAGPISIDDDERIVYPQSDQSGAMRSEAVQAGRKGIQNSAPLHLVFVFDDIASLWSQRNHCRTDVVKSSG